MNGNSFNDIVTLAQYENVNTMGFQSMQEVADLNKALEVGYANPATTGGGVLRVESLEASLKALTLQAKHCAFWQNVPKLPAYSTVEEYNQLNSVGDDIGAFIPEGVMPESNDSGYARQVELVKFLGTVRSVSHQATLVKTTIGDVIGQENTNGILWILKSLEQSLFSGDADMCFLGAATDSTHREWVEFNGLAKQIDSTMTIDMKGLPLNEKVFGEASQMIASNYGIPSAAYLSFGAHEDLCNLIFPKERMSLNSSNGGGYTVGGNLEAVSTPFGKISLTPDVFINNGKVPPSAVPTAVIGKVPTAPSAFACAAMDGADGVWATHEGAGVYDYSVTACNRYGESLPVAITSALTVTSSDLAKGSTFTITNHGTLTVPAEYYNIYKTQAGGSVKMFIGRVAAASQTANGTTTWRETGLKMANTSACYIGEHNPQVVAVKQLAPLMKMDLAILGPAYRWMILCYLTFILYAPKKWAKIINIGRSNALA